MRSYSRLLLGAVLASTLGCGDSKVGSVSGTVKLDGEPLANAVVIFQPLGDGKMNPGVGSIGRTNDKGEYRLHLIGGGNGAVRGKHRVEISCPIDDGQNSPDEDRATKPAKQGSRPLPRRKQGHLRGQARREQGGLRFDLGQTGGYGSFTCIEALSTLAIRSWHSSR